MPYFYDRNIWTISLNFKDSIFIIENTEWNEQDLKISNINSGRNMLNLIPQGASPKNCSGAVTRFPDHINIKVHLCKKDGFRRMYISFTLVSPLTWVLAVWSDNLDWKLPVKIYVNIVSCSPRWAHGPWTISLRNLFYIIFFQLYGMTDYPGPGVNTPASVTMKTEGKSQI
jgi:hypothetical protein